MRQPGATPQDPDGPIKRSPAPSPGPMGRARGRGHRGFLGRAGGPGALPQAFTFGPFRARKASRHRSVADLSQDAVGPLGAELVGDAEAQGVGVIGGTAEGGEEALAAVGVEEGDVEVEQAVVAVAAPGG